MEVTKISSDSACKKLFRNNQRFASFFNAVMFDGKQIVDPATLQQQENDQSTFFDETLKEKVDIKRYRDMIRKVSIKYKSNNNVIYSCKHHVVFCPKY